MFSQFDISSDFYKFTINFHKLPESIIFNQCRVRDFYQNWHPLASPNLRRIRILPMKHVYYFQSMLRFLRNWRVNGNDFVGELPPSSLGQVEAQDKSYLKSGITLDTCRSFSKVLLSSFSQTSWCRKAQRLIGFIVFHLLNIIACICQPFIKIHLELSEYHRFDRI